MLKKQVKGFKKSGAKVKKFTKKKNASQREEKMLEAKSSVNSTEDEENFGTENDGAAVFPKKKRFENDFNIKKWYEEFPDSLTEKTPLDDAQRDALRKEAGTLFEQEIKTNSGSKLIQRTFKSFSGM